MIVRPGSGLSDRPSHPDGPIQAIFQRDHAKYSRIKPSSVFVPIHIRPSLLGCEPAIGGLGKVASRRDIHRSPDQDHSDW